MFKAGFIIDEVFHMYKSEISTKTSIEEVLLDFGQHCGFEVKRLATINPLDDTVNPLYAVLKNLITRGIPTRASILVAGDILENYGFQSNLNKEDSGSPLPKEVLFKKPSDYILPIKSIQLLKPTDPGFDLIFKPILIAQVQFVTSVLLLNGSLSLSGVWKVEASNQSKPLVELALKDLLQTIKALKVLSGHEYEEPEIHFIENEASEADFSIGISLMGDVEDAHDYFIENVPIPMEQYYEQVKKDEELVKNAKLYDDTKELDFHEELDAEEEEGKYALFREGMPVSTTEKIRYRPVGHFNKTEDFVEHPDKVHALEYFLRNLFRKTSFKPGQIAIINNALQCKDTIGILPTGSGKSLTYQLSALLQPGIAMVVAPIRSLMIDQFEKLKYSHFIDNVVFINSNDAKKRRNDKQGYWSEGNFQFVVIGPERFQIVEFRNYLSTFAQNGFQFSYSVIDEAHCISEWGHDFRFSYLRLSDIMLERAFGNNKNEFTQIALTATASFDVIADIQRELKMDNDALLPIPDLSRDELHFKVRPIEYQVPARIDIVNAGLESWIREEGLAQIKYPIIKRILGNDVFHDLNDYNKAQQNQELFWGKNAKGKYPNAGVIFCNTKSNAMGNGVYALVYDLVSQTTGNVFVRGLHTEKYLSIGTFMGGEEENTWMANEVKAVSAKSTENQQKFMNDEFNLMVATKAFGMGIDKQNIRLSIHYSIPQSVESFYQEAGRAGRDGQHSMNYLLYSEVDIKSSMDMIKNAHKGVYRELLILNELLTKVRYEDGFFLDVYLTKPLREKYPQVKNVKLTGAGYLNFYGVYNQNQNFGSLSLHNQSLPLITNFRQNVTEKLSIEITDYARDLIQKIPGNWIDALKAKEADGIETMLKAGGKHSLVIGLYNDGFEKLGKLLIATEYNRAEEIKIWRAEKVIKRAYNFCDGEDESKIETQFIENLKYQYWRDIKPPRYHPGNRDGFSRTLENNEEFKKYFGLGIEDAKKEFRLLRNNLDTQKAVYRLSALGILDDYTIDYAKKAMTLYFSSKSDEDYYDCLEKYLKRYLGDESAKAKVDGARNGDKTSAIRNCFKVFVEFFEEAISEKRKKAAEFMSTLVKDYFILGDEQKFKEAINHYFKSKYARPEYFLTDFADNQENFELVMKYSRFIKNPPDGLGKENDNLQHLKGACNRYRVSTAGENATISMIDALSTLVINTKSRRSYEPLKVDESKEQIFKSLRLLSQKDDDSDAFIQNVTEYSSLITGLSKELSLTANEIHEFGCSLILLKQLSTLNSIFLHDYEQ